MTEGTSQGLFIVVAIVIFGIFIGLSYTLFGSDGLTKDLKGLFENATEDVNEKGVNRNLIKLKNLIQHDAHTNTMAENFTVDEKGVITLTSDGSDFIGIRTDDKIMLSNTNYHFSFNMKVISGNVSSIGGSLPYSDNTKIIINGEQVSDTNLISDGYLTAWNNGESLPSNTDTYKVEVLFNTNGFSDENTPLLHTGEKFKSMYIQPNRKEYGEPYVVEITNLILTSK